MLGYESRTAHECQDLFPHGQPLSNFQLGRIIRYEDPSYTIEDRVANSGGYHLLQSSPRVRGLTELTNIVYVRFPESFQIHH